MQQLRPLQTSPAQSRARLPLVGMTSNRFLLGSLLVGKARIRLHTPRILVLPAGIEHQPTVPASARLPFATGFSLQNPLGVFLYKLETVPLPRCAWRLLTHHLSLAHKTSRPRRQENFHNGTVHQGCNAVAEETSCAHIFRGGQFLNHLSGSVVPSQPQSDLHAYAHMSAALGTRGLDLLQQSLLEFLKVDWLLKIRCCP